MPVAFIGRPGFGREIGEHGLTLSDYSGWQVAIPPDEVDFRCEPEALAEADIIALCVKSGATAEAAQANRRAWPRRRDWSSASRTASAMSRCSSASSASRFAVVRGMVPYNVAYLGDGRFHKGVAGEL